MLQKYIQDIFPTPNVINGLNESLTRYSSVKLSFNMLFSYFITYQTWNCHFSYYTYISRLFVYLDVVFFLTIKFVWTVWNCIFFPTNSLDSLFALISWLKQSITTWRTAFCLHIYIYTFKIPLTYRRYLRTVLLTFITYHKTFWRRLKDIHVRIHK